MNISRMSSYSFIVAVLLKKSLICVTVDPTAIAMLAIENTIAGSLLHNYDLLRESGTTVVGEQRLHIQHCICCLPDDDWSTIVEVHSHPVALMQCRSFLSNHPNIKAVEADDTAGSAAYIVDNQCHGCAAICSADAAKLYGLRIWKTQLKTINITSHVSLWLVIHRKPTSFAP